MNPPDPPRPRPEVPSPYGPDGLFRNLHRCAQKLGTGDWREVVVLLGGDGTSTSRLAAVTRSLALSMFQQTVGDLEKAWDLLDDAARRLPPALTTTDPGTGQTLARFRNTAGTDDDTELHLTLALARITWREQTELSQIRERPQLYPSARHALVRACQEFLVWVEFAPGTWRRQVPRAQLQGYRVGPPKNLHQPTRKNLCERATRLRQFADPAQGCVSDSVWADAGGYPGIKALALENLGTQPAPTWRLGPRSAAGQGLPVKAGCSAAWRFAQECAAPTPFS